jgi:CRP-like cAMP-binding protein
MLRNAHGSTSHKRKPDAPHPVNKNTFPSSSNILLEHLPQDVRDRIDAELQPVSLKLGEIIHKPGERILDLYFPTTCMISVTVTMQNGRTVEAGAIGSREVVGINAFMGGRETTQTEFIVQVAGAALKIKADILKIEFDRNTEMREVMLGYTQAFVAQISQNVACNRLHETTQRFARWLLEVRDRVKADEFPLTHEFMSEMLGIRRASITDAAASLKNEKLIEYKRGYIKIMNLQALEKKSCECYRSLKAEYDSLLPASRSARSGRISVDKRALR